MFFSIDKVRFFLILIGWVVCSNSWTKEQEKYTILNGYYVVHIDSVTQLTKVKKEFQDAGRWSEELGALLTVEAVDDENEYDLNQSLLGSWAVYTPQGFPVGAVLIILPFSGSSEKEIYRQPDPMYQNKGIGTLISILFYTRIFPEGNIKARVLSHNYSSIISQYRAGARVVGFDGERLTLCYKCKGTIIEPIDLAVSKMSRLQLSDIEKKAAIDAYTKIITAPLYQLNTPQDMFDFYEDD